MIINDGYTINNKNYYRGQCIKAINNEMVHNYSQEEVDNVLIDTIITKIAIDKRVLTKENVALTRNRNGEIRNKHIIVLFSPIKDNFFSFNILPIDCFISFVCNILSEIAIKKLENIICLADKVHRKVYEINDSNQKMENLDDWD